METSVNNKKHASESSYHDADPMPVKEGGGKGSLRTMAYIC